jgi:hypothetical protein
MTPTIIVNASLALVIAIVIVALLATAIRRSDTGPRLQGADRDRQARGRRPATGALRHRAVRAMGPDVV